MDLFNVQFYFYKSGKHTGIFLFLERGFTWVLYFLCKKVISVLIYTSVLIYEMTDYQEHSSLCTNPLV